MDRVPDYESVGCVFESRRARFPVGGSDDERWMAAALAEAARAADEGEVPVGCVVVKDGHIVGRGHNRTETLKDPTAHAEVVAIGAAAAALENWRLTGTVVYCTIEPCLMCTGALVLARPGRVVFGAPDPKFGCLGSRYDVARDNRFNHRLNVTAGVLAEEAAAMLKEFFRSKRGGRKQLAAGGLRLTAKDGEGGKPAGRRKGVAGVGERKARV
jgi:tRNA(adenine34) deaminase